MTQSNRSITSHSNSSGSARKMHHLSVSSEKSSALMQCLTLTKRSVIPARRMNWMDRILRQSLSRCCFIPTQHTSPTLGLRPAGRSICSSEVSPSTSGLCPLLPHVTTSRICHQCVVFKSLSPSPNIVPSYQTAFKITTKNITKQVQRLPLLRTARGSLYTPYSH